jgi:hypothetical protein
LEGVIGQLQTSPHFAQFMKTIPAISKKSFMYNRSGPAAILAYIVTLPPGHRHAKFTMPRVDTPNMRTTAMDDALPLISSDDSSH